MAKQILVKRNKKVAFYGVPGADSEVVYHRMKGFTALGTAKNPSEYSRHYVDEAFETSDVVGYSPSMDYTFDQYKGNAVHDDIVKISDDELTGDDTVRDIILVDLTEGTAGSFAARKRSFTVIPDSEGDGTDAYVYSGSFKTKGEIVKGTAALAEDGLTVTFTVAKASV